MAEIASSSSEGLSTEQPRSTARATTLGILAALAGLMFGLDTGVVAGALPFIATDFHAGDALQGWIVSSMMAGATVGSLFAGRISVRFGRTGAMLGAAILFLIGTLFCALAPGAAIMIVGRLFLGLAVGVAAFAAPLYISEITVESVRGAMISFYQLMVSLGIFLAFVSDSLLAPGGHWRWMLGVMAVPASCFLGIVLILPHSPRWLMMRGEKDRARRVLQSLRSDEEVAEAELVDIQSRLQKSSDAGVGLFKSNPNFRRTVFLGMLLQIMPAALGDQCASVLCPARLSGGAFRNECLDLGHDTRGADQYGADGCGDRLCGSVGAAPASDSELRDCGIFAGRGRDVAGCRGIEFCLPAAALRVCSPVCGGICHW